MNVAHKWLVGVLIGMATPAFSAGPTLDITAAKTGVFHHLDASGRSSLAVSGDSVGLAWEDNRSGAPGCYLALKTGAENAFKEFSFGQGECFEPAIAAYDANRFLLIWEDASGVNTALADANGPAAATRLAASGGQGHVALHPQFGAYAAWSAPDGRWRRIWFVPLRLDGAQLRVGEAKPADPAPASDDQTFPVLAASPQGMLLVWEDRRHGHTVIFGSQSGDPGACRTLVVDSENRPQRGHFSPDSPPHGCSMGQEAGEKGAAAVDLQPTIPKSDRLLAGWTPPARVSGNPTGRQANLGLGRGSGAMRPALARFGKRVAATWLDKRDFLSGYDVYAALTGQDAEGLTFAKDQKAQDSFGDAIAQWHVAIAGNAKGELVIAWDDDRDGTSDIWLTRWSEAGFSENFTLPDASGPGKQSDPAIALDGDGNLHLAWIERDENGGSRLRYTRLPSSR